MTQPDYQFHDLSQQQATAKHGMWLFLLAEVVLFGGLVLAYLVLRTSRPDVITYGSQRLDIWSGAIGAVLLLSSSVTIALAARLSRTRHARYAWVLLLMTFCLGVEYLGIKGFESIQQYQVKQTWGASFYKKPQWLMGVSIPKPAAAAAPTAVVSQQKEMLPPDVPVSTLASAAPAPLGLAAGPIAIDADAPGTTSTPWLHHSIDPARPLGAHLFFSLYNLTGWLLAIHVLIGLGVLLWLARRTARREFGPNYSAPLELTARYWHLLSAVALLVFGLYYGA